MMVSDSLIVYRSKGRTKLDEERLCRMCGTSRGGMTRHHIVPKRWFKEMLGEGKGAKIRDCDNNIVPLCAHCHHDIENNADGRQMLRKVLSVSELAFGIQLVGNTQFNAWYPRFNMDIILNGIIPWGRPMRGERE